MVIEHSITYTILCPIFFSQVKSLSPKALSASVGDIGSVVSMIDIIVGSAAGCRMCAASRRKYSPSNSYLMWQTWRDKEFLFFIRAKIEWEQPPSILVTRNPNWSQRSGTGTGCVKGRYQHPKYALPKVSCIVLLSDKI